MKGNHDLPGAGVGGPRHGPRDHEDTGADDGSDAERDELPRPEGPVQFVSFRRRADFFRAFSRTIYDFPLRRSLFTVAMITARRQPRRIPVLYGRSTRL